MSDKTQAYLDLEQKIKTAIFDQLQTHKNAPGDLWAAVHKAIIDAGYTVSPADPRQYNMTYGANLIAEERRRQVEKSMIQRRIKDAP